MATPVEAQRTTRQQKTNNAPSALATEEAGAKAKATAKAKVVMRLVQIRAARFLPALATLAMLPQTTTLPLPLQLLLPALNASC